MEARMHQREEVQLLNMLMIENQQGEVLVLDKPKKIGWEGLTFPGGKVEPFESLVESVRREALEETGLSIGQLEYCGAVHWMFPSQQLRQLGFLYKTHDFTGELQESEEGRLYWIPLDDFLSMEPKSDSMDQILQIYLGKAREVCLYFEGMEKLDEKWSR